MSDTPILSLPEIAEGVASQAVLHNEALRAIEARLVRALSRTTTAPPGSPAEGDSYIVATGATGEWSGLDDQVASFIGGDWTYYTPVEGVRLWVNDDDEEVVYDGAAWTASGGGGSGDVVGPASSTDGHLVQFDGTTGKLLKDGITLDTDGTLAANSDGAVATQKAVKTYVTASGGGAPRLDQITAGTADSTLTTTGTVAMSSGVGAANSTGKTLSITAGAGGATNAGGGVVTITGGAGTGIGSGGTVTIAGGNGYGGGGVTINSGNTSASVTPGDILIQPGTVSGTNSAGAVKILGSTASGVGTGSTITITGGTSVASIAGGPVNITGGTGGSTNAQGGPLNLRGGTGGGTTGVGGNVSLQPGTPAASGAAGNIQLDGGRGAALGTTATGGFVTIPTCAGTPTGTPANVPTGSVPLVYDSSRNDLYFYNSAWVGLRNIPQNSQSTAYTTVAADAGKHLLHPSADTTARIFTIDANATVAYPVGTAITFVNQNSAGVLTIAITSDTMRLAGAGSTGSRTLAANGVATALKITTTEWIISGTGLT